MIRRRVIAALLTVACAAAAAPQRAKVEPSGSLARHGNLDGGYASTVSAADKAYAMGRLSEIERIVLKAAPEFGHLKMFTEISGLSGIGKPNTILNYRYNLVAEEAACVVFYVSINETPRGEPDGAEFEHFFTKAVPGADVTINKLVPPPDPSYEEELFVRDGEVPYHHLTRE